MQIIFLYLSTNDLLRYKQLIKRAAVPSVHEVLQLIFVIYGN